MVPDVQPIDPEQGEVSRRTHEDISMQIAGTIIHYPPWRCSTIIIGPCTVSSAAANQLGLITMPASHEGLSKKGGLDAVPQMLSQQGLTPERHQRSSSLHTSGTQLQLLCS